MVRAIELARIGMGKGAGGPFGAVITRNHQIVGEGHNCVLANHDPTAHGEISAIRDACKNLGTFSLEDCEIYTTGQPCPMCLGAIYWARIRKIYYGFRIEDAAEIGFDDRAFFEQFQLDPAHRSVPSEELGRELALELVRDYQKIPTRQHY